MEEEIIYIEKFYRFKCKDCPTVKEYPNRDKAQDYGWAIARGGKICYCPACALKHRSIGCKGAKSGNNAFKQLTINGVANA